MRNVIHRYILKGAKLFVTNVKNEKNILRHELISVRNSLFREKGNTFSLEIRKNLSKLACYRLADGRYLYSPIKSEVDIAPEIYSTIRKKECYLPRCDKNEPGVMSFYKITSTEDLECGSFGVLEPRSHCEEAINNLKDRNAVCIVPAIAFDRSGHRLGYGMGYYDRFLRNFKGKKIGVVFSELLVDSLPFDRFDETVDFIVSEKGVYTVNA